MNWKNESTWVAIIGALVTILAATGVFTTSESATATSSLTQITTGIVGLVTLIRGISARKKADKLTEPPRE